MCDIKTFVSFSRECLQPILNESGRILYSSVDSLRPGPIYLLGNNPGGSAITIASESIRRSIDAIPTKTNNYYMDEEWFTDNRSYSKGLAPLQRRVVWLLQQLGLNPRSVAASNLIFSRTPNAASIQFQKYANICWPVHEKILGIVAPRVLIVFGNSKDTPYTFIKNKFGVDSEICYPSGHGNWMCRSFIVPGQYSVIGLPHLSRYNIITHRNVSKWIKSIAKL